MLSCTVHGALNGTVSAPVSKSDLHRLIIACALRCGESLIHRYTLSQDIQATANVIGALGASVRFENDCTIVDGSSPPPNLRNRKFCATATNPAPPCAFWCRSVPRWDAARFLPGTDAFPNARWNRSAPSLPPMAFLCSCPKTATACRCTSAENCAAGTSSFPVTSARSTSPGCCLPFRFWKS